MKVCIIGAGPLGLEMALKIIELGGQVQVFSKGQESWGGQVSKWNEVCPGQTMFFSWEELTTHEGRKLFLSSEKEISLEKVPSIKDYTKHYLNPLIDHLNKKNVLINKPVQRAHKRFIGPHEEIAGKSRLHDLFRVVYENKRSEEWKNEVAENPKVYDSLDKNILKDLEVPLEGYVDCDIVIDATGTGDNYRPLGPGGTMAVNEPFLGESKYVLKANALHFIQKKNEVLEKKNIFLVGSGSEAAFFLSYFKNEILSGKFPKVYLLTEELEPFIGLATKKDLLSKNLTQDLEYLKGMLAKEEEQKISQYKKDLKDWESKEPYEKVKLKKPLPPEKRIKYLSGYNITSLDKLTEYDSLFVTIERPSFREQTGDKFDEELQTLQTDLIIQATGKFRHKNLFPGLKLNVDNLKSIPQSLDGKHDEPGVYTLGVNQTLKDGLLQINVIVNDILQYYKKVVD